MLAFGPLHRRLCDVRPVVSPLCASAPSSLDGGLRNLPALPTSQGCCEDPRSSDARVKVLLRCNVGSPAWTPGSPLLPRASFGGLGSPRHEGPKEPFGSSLCPPKCSAPPKPQLLFRCCRMPAVPHRPGCERGRSRGDQGRVKKTTTKPHGARMSSRCASHGISAGFCSSP